MLIQIPRKNLAILLGIILTPIAIWALIKSQDNSLSQWQESTAFPELIEPAIQENYSNPTADPSQIKLLKIQVKNQKHPIFFIAFPSELCGIGGCLVAGYIRNNQEQYRPIFKSLLPTQGLLPQIEALSNNWKNSQPCISITTTPLAKDSVSTRFDYCYNGSEFALVNQFKVEGNTHVKPTR
ncbi:hypothetical protein [Microseira sp. BLCC-F43]|uniref:hypothetical protein n=1 Tax=Microseira sp. BLCC-F43 TaxID=3153602 RepID=UPI0035BA232C